MKKLLFIMLFVTSIIRMTYGQTQATLPTFTTCPGTVVVPIQVTNLNNLGSISLVFSFGNNLTYSSFQNVNAGLTNSPLVMNSSNHKIYISWYSLVPTDVGTGTLVEVVFTGILGTSNLTWDLQTPGACSFTTVQGIDISTNFDNGATTVGGNCGRIEGTVSYLNLGNTPMVNIELLLKKNGVLNSQTTTNASGQYSFSSLADGSYSIDMNINKPWGGVNAVDALKIMKHFVQMTPLTGLYLVAADVNGSGFINSVDALNDMRRFVSLITSFPGGDWLREENTINVFNSNTVTANIKVLCNGDVDGSNVPSTCTPWPTKAKAGPDQLVPGTSVTLAGNIPIYGTGIWSLVSGTGGVIAQPVNPVSGFTGTAGIDYKLAWTISSVCASFTDTVVITFCNPPSDAVAGPDQTIAGNTATLAATQPAYSTGTWSIVTGNGGIFADVNSPATTFSGNYLTNYTLRWTVSNSCGTNTTSEVHINFTCPVPVVEAGPDQTLYNLTTTILAGSMPDTGENGTWTIMSGNGGSFSNSHISNSTFTGTLGVSYSLKWTVTNTCSNSSSDNVTIFFTCPVITTANAGPDQALINVNTTTLAANLVSNGETGTWMIESGSGGNFTDVNSPTSNFIGLYGNSYLLRWTIVNNCGISSSSTISIVFGCDILPSMAEAGPDQTITGTITSLQGNFPSIGTGFWSIVSGINGVLNQPGNPNSGFTGLPGTYTLKWTISTICSNSFDSVVITFNPVMNNPCSDIPSFVYDGQTYNTVQIGNQCWMKENLNIGSPIQLTQSQSNNSVIEKYCYNNDPANCTIYGGLYQWNEMMQYSTTSGAQGICPANWHIPTDAEWCTLTTYLDPTANCNIMATYSNLAGGKMKETGTNHWSSPNNASNTSGFTALGAGYTGTGYIFMNIKIRTNFWSSTTTYSGYAIYQQIWNNSTMISRNDYYKTSPYSVRCINSCFNQGQSDAGPDQTLNNETTTTLAGNSPVNGETGLWSIITGAGGGFSNINSPISLFTGVYGVTYTLRWTINTSTGCSYHDDVNIIFNCTIIPTTSNAGFDQIINNIDTAYLAGNPVGNEESGAWSIIDGDGGVINEIGSPTSTFTGVYGVIYTLRWTISSVCGITSSDDVNITFNCTIIPTTSNAGTDQTLAGTSTVLQGNSPSSGTGLWTIVSGTGGNIAQPTDSNSVFTGTLGLMYTLAWTISTSCANSVSLVKIFFDPGMNIPCNGLPTVTYGGQTYNTRQIGTQCWMKENLNIGTMIPGTQNQSSGTTIEKYCFNNMLSNCSVYGGLYQWGEMMQYSSAPGGQGICPSGWHIPTDAEWCTLTIYLDPSLSPTYACDETFIVTTAGGRMKEAGTTHWISPNVANNESGFTALGSGYRDVDGYFQLFTYDTYFWSSTEYYTSAFYRTLDHGNDGIGRYPGTKTSGYSVRCINNCSLLTLSNAGTNQTLTGQTTTNLSGNSPSTGETGLWTIVNGIGGSFENDNNPTSSFTGSYGVVYTLRWTIINLCGSSSFCDVQISFICETPVTNAGPDQILTNVNTTALSANTPAIGETGIWTIVTGSGGSFSSVNSPNSTFTGSYGITYTLRWTVTNDCAGSSYSMVNITFICNNQPTTAIAGPNQTITGNTTVLQGNTPANGTGLWSIVSGNGGSISQPGNPATVFTGIEGTIYTLKWTISTFCASSFSQVVITFNSGMNIPCPGLPSIVYGGQTYNTVQIGTQCWMKENLNIGSMIQSNQAPNSVNIEKYCYNDNSANCLIYGGLYPWNEMMGNSTTSFPKGICPTGWHVPSKDDFCTLLGTLDPAANCNLSSMSSIAGGKMKEAGYNHWSSPNTGASNASGFTALGTGHGWSGGSHWSGFQQTTGFWSSTLFGSDMTFLLGMGYNSTSVSGGTGASMSEVWYSVRCLKDSCNQSPSQSDAGPDQSVEGMTTSLAGNTPLVGTGSWTILSGSGGNISQPNDPASVFSGISGTGYILTWNVNTACATSIDTVIIWFHPVMNTPCPGLPFFVYGGQTYNTVQIGTQCWMKENLNIGSMIPGSQDQSSGATIEKYCYNNDPANCLIYGGLYQWNEMMGYSSTPGVQGICSPGWHVPTDAEWCTLATSIDVSVNCNIWGESGFFAGGKMKETGTSHWESPNTGATNESGFTALGAGMRYSYDTFLSLNVLCIFWSSNISPDISTRLYWRFHYSSSQITRHQATPLFGHSVRCLKD
ncbi:MAG: hypothetical protein NTU44_00985 [Bacteroidetes bacterium]|nr:hypothetical protein [Bacteroidota bacterium]